ncbi:methyltransferase family protein [Streptomyces halobius]|uniref:Isoprenylcysteine carboxylmethyltransferase family protein n=1 Tax=Streptomyces halobius TaxID=2879846 RepID=A0ABY4LZY7_9ACTN|nr:isoprenylcysteine carboxylmethyltransferase family protein [Streptomyces halobius]UQA91070.1 isoprenylcysteine carboxylmethyltransferase family protein [Streptomyces halobius]
MNDQYGYGLWALVVINTLLLVIFAGSFFHPKSGRDWRVLGGFSAFAVALFTEMYGFPLTIYLLAGPLGNWFPNLGFSHAQGHLWNDLIGWKADPHVSPFHLAAYVLIIVGFVLIISGWRQLLAAQKEGRLATAGPYARIRHPQYTGFLAIMAGFLLMWPTLPTLVMFPVLVWVYQRLARREEAEVAARFGVAWTTYAASTPRFLPSLRRRPPATEQAGRPTEHGPGHGATKADTAASDDALAGRRPISPRTTTASRRRSKE